MVHEVLNQIFLRLEQARKAGTPVRMNLLYRAATYDLISDYAFGQGSICFSREDLNKPYFDAYRDMVSASWHFGCYFGWIGRNTRKLPSFVIKKMMPTSQHFINVIEVIYTFHLRLLLVHG